MSKYHYLIIKALFYVQILAVFSLINVYGQSNKVESTFDQYIKSIRENKYSNFPREMIKPENHLSLINLSSKYITDTLSSIRATGYYILKLVGLSSTKADIRQQVVNKLLTGCKDSKSGNVSICIDYLTQFNISDFSISAKDTMLALLQRKNYYFDEYVKLCGYVLADRVLPSLEKILSGSFSLNRKEQWAVRLAMARAGDENQIAYIVQRISGIDANDEVVYHLIPDLIYTRQRQIFERVIEWLNDDRKSCTSSNPDKEEKLVCGYRIMEMLAPAIKNYPYSLDATGELLTDDYDKALYNIREWFKKNPQYIIVNTQY